MPGHEIVTLQLGSYANYVGAHYWNLQDEVAGQAESELWGPLAQSVDISCLYSEGLDPQGRVTWRPRTLFADLSGALGGVRPLTAGGPTIVSTHPTLSTWSGGIHVHRAPALPKSHFVTQLEEDAGAQDDTDDEDARQAALEQAAAALSEAADTSSSHAAAGQDGYAGVKYWTDYLKVVLPPQSVLTLPGVWHGVTEFSGYGDGNDVMAAGSETREELSERIRALVEDCDSLQGFQVFAEDLGGWGGITQTVMQEIHEEYASGGRPCLLFSVRPPVPSHLRTPAHAMLRHMNESLVLSWVADTVTTYTPISLRDVQGITHGPGGLSWLQYRINSHFETSAVIAAAIDSALLPMRLTGVPTSLGTATGVVNMHSLTSLLTGAQRNCPLTALAAAIPMPALAPGTQQAQAALDARMASPDTPPHYSPTSPATSAAAQGGMQTQQHMQCNGVHNAGPVLDLSTGLSSFTAGIQNEPQEDLAVSLCVRGACVHGQRASVSATQQALNLLARSTPGRMCVQHHAICPLPLLLPLPYPRTLWSANVGSDGQITSSTYTAASTAAGSAANGSISSMASRAGMGSRAGVGNGHVQQSVGGRPSQLQGGTGSQISGGGVRAEVTSVPVASKLFATTQFQTYVHQVGARWQQAANSGAGRVLLDHWQLEHSDVGQVSEALQHLASMYDESDDEGLCDWGLHAH